MKASLLSCVVLMRILLFPALGWGQWREPPATGSPSDELPDRTVLAGQSGSGPLLIAEVANPGENSKRHIAVVKVQTDGLKIVDPETARHEPRLDEAHVQYQMDGGPVYDSTSLSWTFQNLSSG